MWEEEANGQWSEWAGVGLPALWLLRWQGCRVALWKDARRPRAGMDLDVAETLRGHERSQ